MHGINEWIQWRVREARRNAGHSGRSVEHELLRWQSTAVNEIRTLFPYLSVPRMLEDVLYRFSALPEEEKTPLPNTTPWTEEATAWVRARLDQDRHAVHAEGYDFPSSLLVPALFTEAAERFPGQDTAGCIFTTAKLLAFEGRENAEQAVVFPTQTVPAHPTLPMGLVVRALYTAALRAQDPELTARDAVEIIASELRISDEVVDPVEVATRRWILDYASRAADMQGPPSQSAALVALADAAPGKFLQDMGREPPYDLTARVFAAGSKLLRESH